MAPTGVSWSSHCTADRLACRSLQVVSDTLRTYNFYIVIEGDNGPGPGTICDPDDHLKSVGQPAYVSHLHPCNHPKTQYFPVTIEIRCGLEIISLSKTYAHEVLDHDAGPDNLVFSLPLPYSGVNIRSLFSTSYQWCDVIQFNIFYDEDLLLPMNADATVAIGPPARTEANTHLTIQRNAPVQKTIYIQGISTGGIYAVFQLDITVCGNEQVHALKRLNQQYWWYKQPTYNGEGFDYVYLDSLFDFWDQGSVPGCENTNFEIYRRIDTVTESPTQPGLPIPPTGGDVDTTTPAYLCPLATAIDSSGAVVPYCPTSAVELEVSSTDCACQLVPASDFGMNPRTTDFQAMCQYSSEISTWSESFSDSVTATTPW